MRPTVAVRSQADAVPIVAAIARRIGLGIDTLLAFDAQGTLVVGLPLEPGTPLPRIVEMVASIARHGERFMIVSNRTLDPVADRPDDELVWEELVGIARSNGVVMIDWWVVCGTKAFSIAEFAPSPASYDR